MAWPCILKNPVWYGLSHHMISPANCPFFASIFRVQFKLQSLRRGKGR